MPAARLETMLGFAFMVSLQNIALALLTYLNAACSKSAEKEL